MSSYSNDVVCIFMICWVIWCSLNKNEKINILVPFVLNILLFLKYFAGTPPTTKTAQTYSKLHGFSAFLVQSPRKNHLDSKYPWMGALKTCLHTEPNITPKRVQFDMTLPTPPAPRLAAALRAWQVEFVGLEWIPELHSTIYQHQ